METLASLITAPAWSTTTTVIDAVFGDCATRDTADRTENKQRAKLRDMGGIQDNEGAQVLPELVCGAGTHACRVGNRADAWCVHATSTSAGMIAGAAGKS